MQTLPDLVARLVDRDAKHSEATVQADIRSLLLNAPFQLTEGDLRDVLLESPVGDRRRIDIEVGTTVIEVKRDLRRSGVLSGALQQLADYVSARQAEMGRRYVGVLTDGTEWRCYFLTPAGLEEASQITLRTEKPNTEALLVWLEGVLATAQQVPPTPGEIAARLGAGSSAHDLDQASLRNLYVQFKDQPAVKIKRQLWARLLTTALGSQFQDSDDLFVEHTLLVNTADIIAHAVLGLDVGVLSPASLLSGAKFAEHGIHGVVESDFFDWVVGVPRGDIFVRTLALRLARFDWRTVEHDVLKILYESVIPVKTRQLLGEYYTPDWLAEKMVEETVRDPLHKRVLDPACGSGTFLFHAIRRYFVAAEAAGMEVAASIRDVSTRVLGMDLHPVAVTLARVTYLLAIGPHRLAAPTRGSVQIPVFLGDSMQWQQRNLELWTAGYLVIQADGELNLFSLELRFPESLLEDAQRFDELVEELAEKATSRKSGSQVPSLKGIFQRKAIPLAAQPSIDATFRTMCRLHDEGRNHIWGYYVRNLARPVWLAQPGNQVDVLIGNPPWLVYRHMTAEMQKRFRQMSEERKLWHGAALATQQDLSGLFIARVLELYLRTGGHFSFVVPNAALDRAQFAGFRSGELSHQAAILRVAFSLPWDLRRIRPHFFPRGSAVVFGRRVEERVIPMPLQAECWRGQVDTKSGSWATVAGKLERHLEKLTVINEGVRSVYEFRFRNGATIFPRILFLVEELPPGPLGLRSGTIAVRSCRSTYEKEPWKSLPSQEAVVESEFVYPVYLAEHVLPYRSLPSAKAVLPWLQGHLINSDSSRLEQFPGLARWWRHVDELWLANRSSDRLSLGEQLDFHGKLTSQYPLQGIRIVYGKSGMHIAAACIRDRRHVIDHTLYWATATSNEEALFLCAVLNTAEITRQARPLMSYGKDERDIHKHVWQLPIPEFDQTNAVHSQISALGGEVEAEVARLSLDTKRNSTALRREVRRFLHESAKAQKVEELVRKLLPT
jgi:hypothetical protein